MTQEALTTLIITAAAVPTVAVSLAVTFVKRQFWKVDAVYEAICGTTTTPGLRDRVSRVEESVREIRDWRAARGRRLES